MAPRANPRMKRFASEWGNGRLELADDQRFLLLSFKIKVKTGSNYTHGGAEYFSTGHLVLRTPQGEVITTEYPTNQIYPENCPSSCIIQYLIPRGHPGVYSITNDYRGCCGTRQGRVTFTVPPWRKTGSAKSSDEKTVSNSKARR